jgi:two-component system, NtrC family, response regulator PilR
MANEPKTAPPSDEKLRLLLANGMNDVVNNLIQQFDLKYKINEKNELVDSVIGTDLWLNKFLTVDADTVLLKNELIKLSKCNDEVLIIGETGTGKECLAKSLIGNRQVDNKDARIIAVNCAGLPEQLMESELFGYKRGAFTGAESDRQGLMASAKDGLVFFDEVAELPLSMQGKLLRAIQDKVIRRVGSTVEEEIRCRIVCATNKNVAAMVKQGTFREDLYARISVFELHVKPIRERKCDIEPIVCAMPGGKAFHDKHSIQLIDGTLSLEHNVRSLQAHVKRWSILGRVW